MEILYTQLEGVLSDKFPDAKERSEFIDKMGEVIVKNTLADIIESVQNTIARQELVNAINGGDIEKAEKIIYANDIDIVSLLSKSTTDMLDSLLK